MVRLGVSYYGSYLPWHLETDLKDIYDSGCDDVLVTLQENDFKVFRGKVQLTAKIAHKIGLKAVANFWGYACMLGGGRVSWLLTGNPETWQVNREGKKVGMGCMNNPVILSTLIGMVKDAASQEFDGFFIDEPTRAECFCQYCQERFRSIYGSSLFQVEPRKLNEFRSRSVTEFLEKVCDEVKGIDPKLETSTCIMPKDETLWKDAAKIRNLDYFGTDPYWLLSGEPITFVAESTRNVVDLCQRYGKKSLMWILCWKVPKGKEKEIHEATLLCAKEKPNAIYAWSYRGGLGTYEESDDADKAWSSLISAYKELKKANQERKDKKILNYPSEKED